MNNSLHHSFNGAPLGGHSPPRGCWRWTKWPVGGWKPTERHSRPGQQVKPVDFPTGFPPEIPNGFMAGKKETTVGLTMFIGY